MRIRLCAPFLRLAMRGRAPEPRLWEPWLCAVGACVCALVLSRQRAEYNKNIRVVIVITGNDIIIAYSFRMRQL